MRSATASFTAAAILAGSALAPARAQVDELTDWLARERPAHVLTQVCISEASMPERDRGDYDGDGDLTEWINGRHTHAWGTDCWAIHEVFLRGADRLGARTWRNYMRFAMQYSDRVFHPAPGSSRPWIAHLPDSASHAIPEGWPVEWRRVGGMMEARTTWAPHHWEAYQYARPDGTWAETIIRRREPYLAGVAALMRRSDYLRVRYREDVPCLEDNDLWHRASLLGLRFVDVPEAVYRVHRRDGSRRLTKGRGVVRVQMESEARRWACSMS